MSTPPNERPRRQVASSRATGSVTLADVAKLAGVSPITVSRVVNRPELVTANTLAHVQQVIERTGYVPNLLAGGLASKRTRLVAALVPSITNAIFVEAVQALTDRLWEAGYQVLLGLSGYPATREDALLAAVLSRLSGRRDARLSDRHLERSRTRPGRRISEYLGGNILTAFDLSRLRFELVIRRTPGCRTHTS